MKPKSAIVFLILFSIAAQGEVPKDLQLLGCGSPLRVIKLCVWQAEIPKKFYLSIQNWVGSSEPNFRNAGENDYYLADEKIVKTGGNPDIEQFTINHILLNGKDTSVRLEANPPFSSDPQAPLFSKGAYYLGGELEDDTFKIRRPIQ